MTRLEAICKGTGFCKAVTVNGKRILTNGHFVIVSDEAPATDENFQKLAECWQADRIGYVDAIPAELRGSGGFWERVLIAAECKLLMDEAYYRLFLGCSFRAVPNSEKPIHAYRDGELFGLVMPMKGNPGDCEVVTEEPTDDEVYERFACEANGWYGETDSGLLKRIREAERRLPDLDDKIEELEEERAELQAEYWSLHELLDRRLAELTGGKA